MAIPTDELQKCLRAVGALLERRRPPEHIRDQLDFRADIKRSELIISTVRPDYLNPSQIREHPFAKVKWIGTQGAWRLYWMRQNLKWQEYEPARPLTGITQIIEEIDRDPFGCFFG